MIRSIQGKKIIELNYINNKLHDYERVICDLGCGDGKWVYNQAKKHKQIFYIGLDNNADNLAETSHKVAKKASKGGLANCVYIQVNAYNPPNELSGICNDVFIHFPWGDLLVGIVKVDARLMNAIKSILKPKSTITIYLTYDEKFEQKYKVDRALPELNQSYLQNEFKKEMTMNGLTVLEVKTLNANEISNLKTTWGKRITRERSRDVYCIKLRMKD